MFDLGGPLKVGAVLEDRFRLESALGEGGFGHIFKATQLSTGQPVAIKVLLSDPTVERATDTARFEREMQVIARLRHPHVVKLIDSGIIDGLHPYLALEFNPGEALNALLGRVGPPPPREGLRIMRQVLEALAYAHQEGVIHRDLKPHNIMVTNLGPLCNATVLDFGIAHLAEAVRPPDFHKLTPTGEIAGTPTYMSPEQLLSRSIGPPADLYAWGLLLVECLTGRRAIDETSLVTLALYYGSGQGAAIPESLLESPLGPLLERVTRIDPDERYQSAEDVLRDLAEIDPDDLPSFAAPAVATAEDADTYDGPPPALAGAELRLAQNGGPNLARFDSPSPPLAVEATRTERATPAQVAKTGPAAPWPWLGGGILIGLLAALALWALALRPTETAAPPARAANPVSPAPPGPVIQPPADDMVTVEAGDFLMGCERDRDPLCQAEEQPRRLIWVDGFEIDRTEVTVRDYATCVGAGVCLEPTAYSPGYQRDCNWGHPERGQHPVNCATWHDAQRYCGWAGKRLPTEAEWERAARGRDARRFPWGDQDPNCELAVMSNGDPDCTQETTSRVGSRPAGASPTGALDMAGNVEEWTSDWYDPDYLREASDRNPTGPLQGFRRSARGGGWDDDADEIRAATREGELPRDRAADVGFRCARSL